MKRRPFGATGRQVAIIGQGTWQIEARDRGGVMASIRGGLDRGMTHIDSAEMYGSGAAEEIVGGASAGRRDARLLGAKVLPGNASRQGAPTPRPRSAAP